MKNYIIVGCLVLSLVGCGGGSSSPAPAKIEEVVPDVVVMPPVVVEEEEIEEKEKEEPIEEEEETPQALNGIPLISNYMENSWRVTPASVDQQARNDRFELAALGLSRGSSIFIYYERNVITHVSIYVNEVSKYILNVEKDGYLIDLDELEDLIVIYRSHFLLTFVPNVDDYPNFLTDSQATQIRQDLIDSIYATFDNFTINLLGYVIQ